MRGAPEPGGSRPSDGAIPMHPFSDCFYLWVLGFWGPFDLLCLGSKARQHFGTSLVWGTNYSTSLLLHSYNFYFFLITSLLFLRRPLGFYRSFFRPWNTTWKAGRYARRGGGEDAPPKSRARAQGTRRPKVAYGAPTGRAREKSTRLSVGPNAISESRALS